MICEEQGPWGKEQIDVMGGVTGDYVRTVDDLVPKMAWGVLLDVRNRA